MSKPQQIPSRLNLTQNREALRGSKRMLVTARPLQTSFAPNEKITINFPSISSDFKGSYLVFNALATDSTVPGVVGVAFQFPISTIFERVRVLLGSKVLEDISDYNLLHGNMSNLWSADLNSTQAIDGLKMEGAVLQATRATDSVSNNVYTVKLYLDSLRKYMPLHHINGQFRLELTLGSAASVLFDDAAAPDSTYAVSNVLYYYNQLELPAEVDRSIASAIQSGTYSINYRPFANYQNNQLGTNASAQLDIPARFQYVNRVLAINRLDATIVDTSADDRFTKYSTGINKINRLSIKINQDILPPDEMPELANDTAENHWTLFRHYVETFQDLSDAPIRGYNCIAADDWKSASRQVMAFDLRKDPSDKKLLGNGPVLNQAGAQCILRMVFDSAYATSATTDVFIQYEATCVFRGGMYDVEF